jgi:hypothetical protein
MHFSSITSKLFLIELCYFGEQACLDNTEGQLQEGEHINRNSWTMTKLICMSEYLVPVKYQAGWYIGNTPDLCLWGIWS